MMKNDEVLKLNNVGSFGVCEGEKINTVCVVFMFQNVLSLKAQWFDLEKIILRVRVREDLGKKKTMTFGGLFDEAIHKNKYKEPCMNTWMHYNVTKKTKNVI